MSADKDMSAPIATTLGSYKFPAHKLKRKTSKEGKTPLVLVACGSFSPITFLHLRMFEMASDLVRFNTNFEACAGYLSPVSDAYKKKGLAPGHHRVNMCSQAVEHSDWLMVDPFETLKCNADGEPEYVPTAEVLKHFDHEINTVLGGIEGTDGKMHKARIALLAGADLVMSMGEPGLWSSADLDIILGSYGAFIVERSGTDIDEALASLRQYEANIWVMPQVYKNDMSSTKIRTALKNGLSVRYLIPDPVIAVCGPAHYRAIHANAVLQYLDQYRLFQDETSSSSENPATSRATPVPSPRSQEQGL